MNIFQATQRSSLRELQAKILFQELGKSVTGYE